MSGQSLRWVKALEEQKIISKESLLRKQGLVMTVAFPFSLSLITAIGLRLQSHYSLGLIFLVSLAFGVFGFLLVFQALYIVQLTHDRKLLAVLVHLIIDGLSRILLFSLAESFDGTLSLQLSSVGVGPLVGGIFGLIYALKEGKGESGKSVDRISMRSLLQTTIFFSLGTMGLTGLFVIVSNNADSYQVGISVLLFLVFRGLVSLPVSASQNLLISEFRRSKKFPNRVAIRAVAYTLLASVFAFALIPLLTIFDWWVLVGLDEFPGLGTSLVTVVAAFLHTLLHIYSLWLFAKKGSGDFQLIWALSVLSFVVFAYITSGALDSLAFSVLLSTFLAFGVFPAVRRTKDLLKATGKTS